MNYHLLRNGGGGASEAESSTLLWNEHSGELIMQSLSAAKPPKLVECEEKM
jgi:hypothetical protein